MTRKADPWPVPGPDVDWWRGEPEPEAEAADTASPRPSGPPMGWADADEVAATWPGVTPDDVDGRTPPPRPSEPARSHLPRTPPETGDAPHRPRTAPTSRRVRPKPPDATDRDTAAPEVTVPEPAAAGDPEAEPEPARARRAGGEALDTRTDAADVQPVRDPAPQGGGHSCRPGRCHRRRSSPRPPHRCRCRRLRCASRAPRPRRTRPASAHRPSRPPGPGPRCRSSASPRSDRCAPGRRATGLDCAAGRGSAFRPRSC